MNIETISGIDASASQAWSVFGDGFGDWAQWSGGIEKSTLGGPLAEGVMRTNDTRALGVVTQELTHFDAGSRSLTYEFKSGLPAFLRGARNEWIIEDLGSDCSRIVGHASFDVAWWARPLTPLLRRKMAASLQGFAAEFAAHVKGA